MAASIEWRCTSCSTLNVNDRNNIACTNCYILDSDINIKRAKQLYILGNISNPSVCFIPLKIPFFIYPLSPPIIKYSIQYQQEKEVIINFKVELWDNRHIENYHIQSIKIDTYLTGNKLSTIINANTPYYNLFPFHIKKYKSGFQTIDVYAKCYNSTCISPKQSLKILLSPSNTNIESTNKSTVSKENDNKEDDENKIIHCWYFKNDDDKFQSISDDSSETISRMKEGETKMIMVSNRKYLVTKTTNNQCIQRNIKTNKMRELRVEQYPWLRQYQSIVCLINDTNNISEDVCSNIVSLQKKIKISCIYNESNSFNLICELLKRGQRNDCNDSLLIGIHEAINNIIHFMPEIDINNNKMMKSLLSELVKIMNNNLNIKNEDNDIMQYRLSGLFSSVQVLLNKLGPNCLTSHDSNIIIHCCCNLLQHDVNNNIVYEEGVGLIACISRSIGIKFRGYLETASIQELLIKLIRFGINNKSLCCAVCGCIADVYTACTLYISTNPLSLQTYSHRIVSELKSILINVNISILLKSYIVDTLTDILISHGKYAQRYIDDILDKCLEIGCSIPSKARDEEMNEFRRSITDLCRSWLAELAESNKINNFNKYIPKINNFFKTICDDINRININVLKSVIKLLCEAVDYFDNKTTEKLCNPFTQKILLKAQSKKHNDSELAKAAASTNKIIDLISRNKAIRNKVVNCWYFKNDDGKFEAISDDLSSTISRMKQYETKMITIRNWKYLVTKTANNQCIQKNIKTNKVRELTVNLNHDDDQKNNDDQQFEAISHNLSRLNFNDDDQKNNMNQKQRQQRNNNDDGIFVSHISYQEAMQLQIGDKIDIRGGNGRMYGTKICEIEMKENKKDKMMQKFVKIDKFDEWINIDLELFRLAIYKSISRRPSHRLSKLRIGDFIDVNPIYLDPGWKPAEITNIYSLSGQIEVKFNHSISKKSISYCLHLDNTIECDEFGKGHIDEKQVEALFFATISSSKYKIIEIKDICSKNSINVYEAILRGKTNQKHEIEKYLWHGMRNINVLQSILQNGFDRSYNRMGKYGKGTYFAKNAVYSVEGGYCGKNKNNLHFLLLCRVIIGEYIEGKENMKTIPKRRNEMEYDSLVNNKNNPQIFVSWRDYHAIPYYLIKFKSLK